MMKLRVIAAAALLASASAQALPTSLAIGEVTILGTSYYVSLLYDTFGDTSNQSFNALSPTITFTDVAGATAAVEALRDTFGASYDWNPASSSKGARVAFFADSTDYSYMTVSGCCGAPYTYGPFTYERDRGNYFSFAQFTPVVPEPETYAMMLLGLAAVGLVRRHRQA